MIYKHFIMIKITYYTYCYMFFQIDITAIIMYNVYMSHEISYN